MEATILSAFLEELVYQSDVKCHINDLFERLEDRGLPCDNTIKVILSYSSLLLSSDELPLILFPIRLVYGQQYVYIQMFTL